MRLFLPWQRGNQAWHVEALTIKKTRQPLCFLIGCNIMEHYKAFVYQEENLLKIERKLVLPPAFELFDTI
jgi:hypothetical protein